MSNETRKKSPQDHAEEDRGPLEKANIQNRPFFCSKNFHGITPLFMNHEEKIKKSEGIGLLACQP
jgi:hypothetical protein